MLILDPAQRTFPPFDLQRLIRTSFGQGQGEKLCILIDLPHPERIQDFAFVGDPTLPIQNYGYSTFYQGLRQGALEALQYSAGDLFAYAETGGSNLDLDDTCYAPDGRRLSLERDIYPHYALILTVSKYSATAPLTAACKRHGFRGATLHGLNQIILDTGLSVDYNEVSAQTETLRLGLTRPDAFEIDFEVEGLRTTLTLDCDRQEAQKSHGLCPRGKPDVANLPAGEVYFVPTSAQGQFPFKYEDGTLAMLEVAHGAIQKARLLYGDYARIQEHNARLADDPMTGVLGELGFGTQVLPFSGRDIQDEKILGTVHIATGRSDHLGGHLTPQLFKHRHNASHDDILYAPLKTPEIRVPEVRLLRDGRRTVTHSHYRPAAYLVDLLSR